MKPNDWTNEETWIVAMQIRNNEILSRWYPKLKAEEMHRVIFDDLQTAFESCGFTDMFTISPMVIELLRNALEKVNWYEIEEYFREE